MSQTKILIIDDNPGDILILKHCLDELDKNYELIELADGEAALRFVQDERARRESPIPCVMLLDLRLPRHSGLEVLKAVREEPVLAHVSVLVLSSVASPAEQAEIRNQGAHYRAKPADLNEFRALAAFILDLCRSGVGA
jgi:two-component system response regulator